MSSSTFLQLLVNLACLALVTQAAAPQSYRSLKTVLSNLRSATKLDPKCEPTCFDSNGDPIKGGHTRDPTRCDQYWVCLPDGTLYEHPHVCADKEIVNVDKLVCETEIIGADQCDIPDPDCDPSIPKLCYHKDTCPPSSDGLFAYWDEADCNKYHVCHFDATISCDNEEFFNGQECVADKSECCECQAVCSEAWSFIPDPTDSTCQNYYLCQDLQAKGVPYIATEEEQFKCPGTEKFDTETGICSEEAICTRSSNCI